MGERALALMVSRCWSERMGSSGRTLGNWPSTAPRIKGDLQFRGARPRYGADDHLVDGGGDQAQRQRLQGGGEEVGELLERSRTTGQELVSSIFRRSWIWRKAWS